jgi:hypothetical protein
MPATTSLLVTAVTSGNRTRDAIHQARHRGVLLPDRDVAKPDREQVVVQLHTDPDHEVDDRAGGACELLGHPAHLAHFRPVEPHVGRRTRGLGAALAAAALAVGLLAACGGDDNSSAPTTTPTTPKPIEEYRAQYLELLTANKCSDQETVAVQHEIAPNNTVGPDDFPVIKDRLFPAWATRSEGIAEFQDGLASADWSDKLTPIVDELIADLEESRASYRAASELETFDAFAQFVFPSTGDGEGKMRKALDIPTDQDDTIDWCAGVPDLGPTTTTTAVAETTTSLGAADSSVPEDSTTTTGTPAEP